MSQYFEIYLIGASSFVVMDPAPVLDSYDEDATVLISLQVTRITAFDDDSFESDQIGNCAFCYSTPYVYPSPVSIHESIESQIDIIYGCAQ